jgi:hypothetical protein
MKKDFWERVQKSDGCWLWLGPRDKRGYGVVNRGHHKTFAHRHAYENVHGLIPTGMCICHHCDNPPCVNPSHLFIGTHADNMRDRDRKGRLVVPNTAGEANGRAKVTALDAKAIRWLVTQGARQAHLAEAYGVSRSLVNGIVKKRVWV